MQLTQYTDYSLRVLIYLGRHDSGLSTITEIADFYRISRNHLVKVVHHLGQCGYIETHRGKNGGIRLAKPPAEIQLGQLIRDTEPNLNLAECFDQARDHCVITRDCKLKGVLYQARNSFLSTLNAYTLADVLG